MNTRRIVLAGMVAACLTAAAPAAAEDYPARIVKLIVPFPPGGPIDTMARLVAHELASRLQHEEERERGQLFWI